MRAEAFAAALRDPALAPPAGFGGAEPARRFAVYRNNVTVSLVEALAATYPATQALTGATFFRAAAREYLRADPPRSPVLIDWGGGFAAFLDAFPPARRAPYLGDVARLEWAWTRAFHAPEAEPATIALLGSVAPEAVAAMRLALHPSLRLVASRFPVVSLWAEVTGRAGTAPDMARGETALALRPEDAVHVHAPAPGDAAFLGALAGGASVGAAAEAAAAHPDFDLGAAFLRLFEAGAVTGFAEAGAAPAP